MKRFLKLFALALVLMVGLSSCMKVEQGFVGLKVDLLGDEKGGVTVLTPGLYNTFGQFNVDYLTYPVFVKQYPFTKALPTLFAIWSQTHSK